MSNSAGHGRKLVRNTLINASSSIFVTAYAFFLTPLLLDKLGEDDFGSWILALTLTLTQGYLPVLDFGIGQAALRRMSAAIGSSDHAAYSAILRHLVATYAVIGLSVGIAIAACSHLLLGLFSLPNRFASVFLFIAVQASCEFFAAGISLGLEARARYAAVRAAEMCGRITLGIAIVVLLNGGYGVVWIAGASALASAFVLAILVVLAQLRRFGGASNNGALDWVTVRMLASEGKWFGVSRLFSVIYAQMDRLIIGVALSTVAVSHYEVAYKIQALAALVLTVIPSAVFPATAQIAASGDLKRLKLLFLDGTRYAVGFSIPACISLLYFTEPLIRSWLSDDYVFMVGSTRMFVSWTLLASFHTIAAIMIAALGRSKTSFKLVSTSVGINLLLSVCLAPHFGVRGVIIGTFVGYAVVFPLYLVVETRLFNVSLIELTVSVVRPLVLPVLVQALVSVPLMMILGSTASLITTASMIGVSTLVGWGTFVLISLESTERHRLRVALVSR